MHARLIALVITAIASHVGSAHAQPFREPYQGGPPMLSPGFALLDRQDGQSRGGVDATYFLLDNNGNDARVMRFDLHGQIVNPESRIGGYLALPLAVFDDNTQTSSAAIGNLEVGGIYLPRLASREVALVLHGGITLPTGDRDEDAFTGLVVGLMRPGDLVQAFPRSSSLRFGISPIYRSGHMFGRVDFGLDVNVYVADGDTIDPAIHVNVGGGYDTGAVAIMGELSILELTGDNSESVTVGALSVRGTRGTVRPYGALVIPIDDDVSNIFDLGLMLGIEAKL